MNTSRERPSRKRGGSPGQGNRQVPRAMEGRAGHCQGQLLDRWPMLTVGSPLHGTVVSIDVGEGDVVRSGQQVLVIESMKMQHPVEASASGIVRKIEVSLADTVVPGQALVVVEEGAVDAEDERQDDIRAPQH